MSKKIFEKRKEFREKNLRKELKLIRENDERNPVEYRAFNKPLRNEYLRVKRGVDQVKEGREKPKKIGFYKRLNRNAIGSVNEREKIVEAVFIKKFGNSFSNASITPDDFKKALLELFAEKFPAGKSNILTHPSKYNSAQRLYADKTGDHRTVSTSAYGDAITDLIDEYKEKYPEFNEQYREFHTAANQQQHFKGSAGFIRYTTMTDDWIHIDAFQSDYFTWLRDYYNKHFRNVKGKEIIAEFSKKMLEKENDVYKTAVSYMVNSHPDVKLFTMNTEQTIKRVEFLGANGYASDEENEKEDKKAKILYGRLPKDLGFERVPFSHLIRTFEKRPGKKGKRLKEKLNYLENAYPSKTLSPDLVNISTIKTIISSLKTALDKEESNNKMIEPSTVDSLSKAEIRNNVNYQRKRTVLELAFHQKINDISKVYKNKNTEEKNKYFYGDTLANSIKEIADKASVSDGDEVDIWWANRTMIFEDKDYNHIKNMLFS